MMTRHYCTYFDQNYLLRGLTLYRSLTRHGGSFVLWVLCLDDASYEAIDRLALSNLRPIRLADLEEADPELHAAKANRSVIEYYFTLSPAWPSYLLNRFAEIDLITYVDSDLLFYSSPEPIFEELGRDSVLIIGHRFPEHLRHLEEHGVYNVGLASFRNDERGRACLEQWREQCLEWCHARVEDGKYAEQKYLDRWPEQPGVRVLQHPGAGLAPWNWMRYDVLLAGDSGTVDGQPLIFFHFHGFKIVNRWFFQPSETGDPMPRKLRRGLYGRYLRELSQTQSWLQAKLPGADIAKSVSVRYAPHTLRDIVFWLRRGRLHLRVGTIPLG
jgi:hypothetical protein